MKVKLLKVHSETTYDDYSDIVKACVDVESEWEEVSDEEYHLLWNWANEAGNKKDNSFYIVVAEPYKPDKECIAEQMEKERVRFEQNKKAIEQRRLAEEKRKEEAKAKKLEKLKKQLALLEEMK